MRIGVDLGGTKIEAIALTDDGQELVRERIKSPRHNYDETIDAINNLVQSVTQKAKCDASTPVGIGIPGALSSETGLVKNANSTWLIGRQFDRDLEAALARPVRLANDANCFALSEAVDGAGQGYGMVFGIILGTGVGGGIAIEGRTHIGLNAIAGEWGHNPLPWPQDVGGLEEHPGPQCYCGEHGCIETFLSGPAMAADHRAATNMLDLTAKEIEDRAVAGDSDALRTVDRYLDRLARALATMINIMDPDVIVCGGGLSNMKAIYETVPARLQHYVFSDSCQTPVIHNLHGDSSGVRGAAWLWPNQGRN